MQRSFGKGLMAGAAGAAILLTIIAAASGTALSQGVSHGHAPVTANPATKAASLSASPPAGITAGALVRGSGHMATAQVQLKVGKSATLLRLGAYGTFRAFCVSAPLAEMNYAAPKHMVRLWVLDTTLTGSGVSEQNMPAGSSLGIQTGPPEQITYTIQNANSSRVNTRVATVSAVWMVTSHGCDFAVTAYTGT